MATRKNRAVLIFLLLFVLVVVLTGTSIYFYRKANRVNTQADSQMETKQLVTAVGKLMYLPENETPTVATVSDPSKLANQAFFADAKKGDKVLIYTSAKKAILYDPAANKIVNVAPIDLGANTPGTTTTPPGTNQ